MSIINGSNSGFGYASSDTFRAKAKELSLSFAGLKPLTRYDFYINGSNYNWASRTYGADLGDPLISDAYGKITVLYVFEIPYEGSGYSPTSNRQYDQSVQLNSQEQAPTQYATSMQLMELIAPGSYVSVNVPLNIIVTPEHINRIEGHSG